MPTEEDFRDAKNRAEAQHKAPESLKAIGHAVAIDIGPKIQGGLENPDQTCLRLYVEQKRPKKAIDDRLYSENYGVPSDVIEIGRIVSFLGGPGASIGFDGRDLPPNVDPAAFGTMGAVVGIRNRHYVLASNHAMAVNGRAIGAQIVFRPPGRFIDDPDQYIFARVTNHVHLTQAGPNTVDCALAEIEDVDRVRAEFPNRIVTSAAGIDPEVQMPVQRVDESEQATGVIVNVSAQPRFDFSFGSFDFENLVLIKGDDNEWNLPFARPGDSGALVAGFDKQHCEYRAAAIVIGGSRNLINGRWKSYTFACWFDASLAELQKTIVQQGLLPIVPKIELVFDLPQAAVKTAGQSGLT